MPSLWLGRPDRRQGAGFRPGWGLEGPPGPGHRPGAERVASLDDPAYRVRDLSANLVLRWEYRPGSALYVVWSQERQGAPASDQPFAPARDLFGVFGARPTNTFLVKLSYWFAPRR